MTNFIKKADNNQLLEASILLDAFVAMTEEGTSPPSRAKWLVMKDRVMALKRSNNKPHEVAVLMDAAVELSTLRCFHSQVQGMSDRASGMHWPGEQGKQWDRIWTALANACARVMYEQ